MTTQPDALRLADLIDWPSIAHGQEAASELRRLHAELEQLKPLGYIDMASYALINSVKAASPNTPINVVVHTQPFVSEKDNPLSECVPIYTHAKGGT